MRKDYIKKILKILSTANLWVLDQIYQFAVNMTKDPEHENVQQNIKL